MALLPETRKSWPTRLTATLFIMLILLGNYLIVTSVMGIKVPGWIFDFSGFLVVSLFFLVPTVIYLNQKEAAKD